MKNMNTARKLSLDEIQQLPKASVIWLSFEYNGDDGIIWHSLIPVLVAVPGAGGFIVGGSEAGIFDNTIDDTLFENPTASYWNQKPDDDQIPGITGDEYDQISGGPVTMALAAAITNRWPNFKKFCAAAGFNYDSFMAAMAGEREFIQMEIVSMVKLLELTADEAGRIFFPDFAGQI